jgi:DNA-binding IscR family transcriptional regulator
MDCVSEAVEDQTCPLIDGCETRPVWMRLRDSIVDAIDSQTLADLVAAPKTPAASSPQVPTAI